MQRLIEILKKLFSVFGADLKFKKEDLSRIVPFVLFISFLTLTYIANKYYSEKTILKISKTNHEIEDLRAECITTKADLTNYSKQSEIIAKASEMGLKPLNKPAKKLVLDKQ
jgi:hypothetical protein